MHENSRRNLEKGAWKPGQSGNPAGRPRSIFTDQFVRDMLASWSKYGAATLETMAKTEPFRFADLASRLIPKDVAISLEQKLPGGLDPIDWGIALQMIEAIKVAIPDAGSRQPGEVMEYVRNAIHAHGAKLIEPSTDVATMLPNGRKDSE